ncbi:MAG: hypothetical protein WAM42_05270 [Candidatus Nitrosopolaris sp.]
MEALFVPSSSLGAQRAITKGVLLWQERASIIKMTIGAFGVYVVAIVRTQTLKIVLSRVCIFATQDRRPLVLWLGNGVCASAFWGLWSHAAASWACEEGRLTLLYRKTNSQIASPLGQAPFPK